jgi:hypothetical protein
MSHTTTIRSVGIRDTQAIEQAVNKLKSAGVQIELATNRKPRMYYRDQGDVCEYVLALAGSEYDVGLKKQADGTYAPMFDEYNGKVARVLGASGARPTNRDDGMLHQIGKFLQAYTECATVNAAISQGYMVSGSSTDSAGNVCLILEGM